MDPAPLVSIIVPTYNYADFLPAAVESALGQTYPRREVIIVDDGSTDGTRGVAESFGDRVRYIRQENAGLAAARNTGIREARGECLVFLDADDLLLPEMVEVTVEKLSSLPEDYALVACRFEWMNADGGKMDKRLPAMEDCDLSALDLLVASRFGCSVLVKKRSLEECGLFDTGLSASEDRDMWIRLAAAYRVHMLSRVLFRVRRHASNMSNDGRRQIEAIMRVLEKARRSGALQGWRKVFWLKVRSYFFYQSSLMLAAGQPARAFRYLLASILMWPRHGAHAGLDQRAFFRLRALARCAMRASSG